MAGVQTAEEGEDGKIRQKLNNQTSRRKFIDSVVKRTSSVAAKEFVYF